MKYDSYIVELKNLLPTAKSILIAVPSNANIDKLASALGLFLLFEQQGKEVSIVTEDAMKVGQSHLFGVDHVQSTISQNSGGNLTLTLEGVASSDGTVPALEKLDWFAENSNLNLVFHVLPGQTFQPARIVPKYNGGSFNLIITVGALNLNSLGSIYTQNQSVFSGVHTVNIDNQQANTSFGHTNVVDPSASSLSEMVSFLISDLGYNLDQDIATNLLNGIYSETNNLSDPKINADTFVALANNIRAGGQKPLLNQVPQPTIDLSGLMPKNQPQVQRPQVENFVTPPVVNPIVQDIPVPQPQQPQPTTNSPESNYNFSANQPSQEERPAGEGVVSETIEPEWLTPKVFKGSSLG